MSSGKENDKIDSSSSSGKSKASSSNAAGKSALKKEEIFAGFEALRKEQRSIASNLSTLEMDLNEHAVVVSTLELVDPERKCFRMIGGILTERKVKDVLPVLKSNTEQLARLIKIFTVNLEEKGLELNRYREQHNIKLRGQDDPLPASDKEEQSTVLVVNN